jgi:osmotically-inducible protein OsmY
MANRFNDRDREERNYYTSRSRDREHGGQQEWQGNQEGREWYETEQPEYNSDFESGRYRSTGENRGMRSSYPSQGSERFGRQNWGQEGGGGQYNRSNEFEDYGQRGGGQTFGQGRQSFGQGRSQQGQFQNYGQENWRTHRGSSQEQQGSQQRYGQQFGGETGEYGFGGRGQYGTPSGWGGGSTGSQNLSGQSGQYGFGEGSQYGQSHQYGQGSQGSQFGQGSQWGQSGQYGQRGQFSGRGPKGYSRSDDRIKEDINERLTHDPDIDAWEIEVQVSSGEVTLTGTVDDRNAKRRAEDIAEAVSGVKDVQNQIRVKKGDQDRGSDFKKDSTFSSELSDKDKDKGQGGIKANIK